MGAVTLRVGDLDGMIRYYRDGVTLELLRHDGPVAVLGRGATPVVILEHAPELRHASPRDAGLFHTAILFDSREALAAAVYSVRAEAPRHLHRQRRPPRERGVLLHRPRGQRRRALLRPRPVTVELDPRAGRDGHALPRPERVPARAPHRAGADAAAPGSASAMPSSATCTSRSATSRARASSTSTGSASRRPRASAARRSSSRPAATTTTWR